LRGRKSSIKSSKIAWPKKFSWPKTFFFVAEKVQKLRGRKSSINKSKQLILMAWVKC